MAASTFTDFNLPKNAYAAFDAVSLKQLIKERLAQTSTYTDYEFESSNLSSIIDMIAYAYHVSLFYLNNRSAESDFNQAELYENINKLVGWIDYKPQGPRTSLCSFEAVGASSLTEGNYIIPKFSFISYNGISHTILNDIFFEKTTTGEELLESIGNQNLLYQGEIKEYPTITATGQEFESFTLSVGSDAQSSYIDNNLFAFVRDNNTGVWSEWTVVDSLYTCSPVDRNFERKFNPYGRYEIKFGSGIYGRKLNAGDTVAIYYLQSLGSSGAISANIVTRKTLNKFNTQRFREISADIYSGESVISATDLNKVLITNNSASTVFKDMETGDEIKKNAPLIFQTQGRAVTIQDFESIVARTFSNLIISSKVINNTQYINEYVKYFYSLGLARPNDNADVLLNQVAFADSCDFNNVHIIAVPKNFLTDGYITHTLPLSLKTLIVRQFDKIKVQSIEVVPTEPTYIAIDIGVSDVNEDVQHEIKDTSFLSITRSSSSTIHKEQIKREVYNTLVQFFNPEAQQLGQLINIVDLTQRIASIPGVGSINTVRKYGSKTLTVPGISLIFWNTAYPRADVKIAQQNTQLEFFKFPFLYNPTKLLNRIIIT